MGNNVESVRTIDPNESDRADRAIQGQEIDPVRQTPFSLQPPPSPISNTLSKLIFFSNLTIMPHHRSPTPDHITLSSDPPSPPSPSYPQNRKPVARMSTGKAPKRKFVFTPDGQADLADFPPATEQRRRPWIRLTGGQREESTLRGEYLCLSTLAGNFTMTRARSWWLSGRTGIAGIGQPVVPIWFRVVLDFASGASALARLGMIRARQWSEREYEAGAELRSRRKRLRKRNSGNSRPSPNMPKPLSLRPLSGLQPQFLRGGAGSERDSSWRATSEADWSDIVELRQCWVFLIQAWRDVTPKHIREVGERFCRVASELADRTSDGYPSGDVQTRKRRSSFVDRWIYDARETHEDEGRGAWVDLEVEVEAECDARSEAEGAQREQWEEDSMLLDAHELWGVQASEASSKASSSIASAPLGFSCPPTPE
ncbi:hypothetical protein P7C70_g8313, partial [Phenoliferia sp. Uapishka_3]